MLPPPGGDVIGRRRLDTHFLALRAARRHGHRRPTGSNSAPTQAQGRRRLPRRAERHGHRERADGRGRGAWHDDSAQRRLRAARAGPRAFPGRARRPHRGHRHQHHHRCTAGDARLRQLHDPARSHRGGLVHRSRRGDAFAAAHRARRRRAPALDPDGLRAARHRLRGRGRRPHRARPTRRSKIQDDFGGHVPKLEDQPWPAFPGRPDVDRHRHRDPVRRRDPDAREDVRVADVLRRQADRDGRRASCCAIRTARSWPGRAGCAAR